VLSSAEAHRAEQEAITTAVERQAASLWSRVQPAAVVASWVAVLAQLLRLVTAGQLASARLAGPYVAAALAEQNVDVPPVGAVIPARFAGAAADGRDLQSLLEWPVTGRDGVLDRIGQGADPVEALVQGGRRVGLMAGTSVQDAGRAAVGVEVFARPKVGFVRALEPPSCARCVILAGKWFRADAGFDRHPGCDCFGVPAEEADAPYLWTDPQEYVRLLSEADQDRLLTKASARAWRDGADLNQLVNAKRGLSKAGLVTKEGTTRRGLAGQRLAGRKRLTPDAIYALSSDRASALDLLRKHGYLLT
jgi:hypothetical protein